MSNTFFDDDVPKKSNTKMYIGIGFGFGLLVVIALIGVYLWRRKRNNIAAEEAATEAADTAAAEAAATAAAEAAATAAAEAAAAAEPQMFVIREKTGGGRLTLKKFQGDGVTYYNPVVLLEGVQFPPGVLVNASGVWDLDTAIIPFDGINYCLRHKWGSMSIKLEPSTNSLESQIDVELMKFEKITTNEFNIVSRNNNSRKNLNDGDMLYAVLRGQSQLGVTTDATQASVFIASSV